TNATVAPMLRKTTKRRRTRAVEKPYSQTPTREHRNTSMRPRHACPSSAGKRGRGSGDDRFKKRTSSGKQMSTSEQRGYFGQSSSGGGICADWAMPRKELIAEIVLSTRSSSNGTRTRDAAK